MNRGDVVKVDWPFSDQSGSKNRPAVVVQADYLTGITDDKILVQITSKIHGITGTEVILAVLSPQLCWFRPLVIIGDKEVSWPQ